MTFDEANKIARVDEAIKGLLQSKRICTLRGLRRSIEGMADVELDAILILLALQHRIYLHPTDKEAGCLEYEGTCYSVVTMRQ